MSSVTFHAETGSARLRGMERAWASIFCGDLTVGLLRSNSEQIAALLPRRFGHLGRLYFPDGLVMDDRVSTWLRVGEERVTLPDSRTFDPFELSLNTAIAIGNDATRLLARLHSQCEIHGWVDGPNRAWLASLIDEGLASGLMRLEMGWESVAALLRSSDQGAVVTSYSVCDTFPNPYLLGIGGEDPWEAMSKLKPNSVWKRAMKAISGGGLEWKPDDWATIRFGDGVDAMSLRKALAIADPPTPSGVTGG